MIDELTAALARHHLTAHHTGGALHVTLGRGPLAKTRVIDPEQTLDWLTARPASSRRTDTASWANAIAIAMTEPKHSPARQWSFVEAAGSIFPTVEGAGFLHGVRDATGEDAWAIEIGDEDHVMAWILRLGRGLRPLTTPHVEDWGATRDRIVNAGRSLLYNATREHAFKPDAEPDVLHLRIGDGHDAARLWVVADVYFVDVDSNWRFAIPTPNDLLAVRAPDHVGALRAAAQRRVDNADYPLSTHVWTITPRGPQRTDDA